MINFGSQVYTADNAFDALVYGEKPANVVNFFNNQFDRFSNILTESTANFFNKGKELYTALNSSHALEFARNVIKNVMKDDAHMNQNYIMPLFDINKIQQSSLVMQRWVMANPVVRGVVP